MVVFNQFSWNNFHPECNLLQCNWRQAKCCDRAVCRPVMYDTIEKSVVSTSRLGTRLMYSLPQEGGFVDAELHFKQHQKQQHEFDALRAYLHKSFQILGISTPKIFWKYTFLFYHKDDYCDGELYPLISLGHHEDAFSRGNKIRPIIVQLKFLEII